MLLASAVAAGASTGAPKLPGDVEFRQAGAEPGEAIQAPASSGEARNDSRQRYSDLGSAAALDSLEQHFKPVLEARLIPELELPDDQEVNRHLSASTARIDIPGRQADLLAEGTLPLRAMEDGNLRPLDADLESVGAGFQAANSLVEPRLSKDASEALVFPAIDTAVSLADSADLAQRTDDKLFFPNLTTDVDALVTPSVAGAEIAYQLRSNASPQTLSLDFDLPAGARLEGRADGGATAFGDHAQRLLEVGAPVAWDAEGTPVAVEYVVAAGRIEIEVSHRDEDLLYPILVDPAIESYYQLGWNQPIELWEWSATPGNPGFTWSREVDGLQQAARGGYGYTYSASQFIVRSIRQSFIERVNFYNFDRFSGNPAACTVVGLVSSSGGWEPGTVQNEAGTNVGVNGQAVQAICDPANQNITHNSRYAWVGWDPNPEDWAYDQVGSNGNFGYWGLLTGGTRYNTAHNRLRSALIFRYDYNAPAQPSMSPAASGQWRRAQGTQSLQASSSDPGLGMYSLKLTGTDINPAGNGTGDSVTAFDGCNGSRSQPCDEGQAATLNYKLLEGRRQLTLTAADVIGHTASRTWEELVDRTAPTITDVAGSLKNERADLLASMNYELTAAATDGVQGGSPSAQRSGVEAIQVFVDGQPLKLYDEYNERMQAVETTQQCPASVGSCPMNATFTIPGYALGAGTHLVEVRATDKLGHTSTSSFSVTVRSDSQEPQVQVSKGAPAPDGSFALQIDATDPAAPGEWASGVETLEVFADGEEVETFSQSCAPPDQGCSMQRTVNFPAGSGDPEIAVDAYDRAGNGNLQISGARLGGFERFGYNELRELETQGAGGADTMRMPVDWCSIQPTEDPDPTVPGPDPEDWNWPDQNFAALADQNDGPPATDLEAIPVMVGSPAWANDEPDGTPCQSDPDPTDPFPAAHAEPPLAAYVDEYGAFIAAFLARYGPACENAQTAPQSCALPGQDTGVGAVQIWNEPNLFKFWGKEDPDTFNPDPTLYAKLVEEGAAEVSAYNQTHGTDIPLVVGGLSPEGRNPRKFWEDATDHSRPTYIHNGWVDVVALHLYASSAASAKEARKDIDRRYTAILEGLPEAWKQSGSSKPLWITEIGFPSIVPADEAGNLPPASEQSQRHRLRQAYWKFAWKERVKAFIVHRLVDHPEEPRGFGVIRQDLSNKPIFCDLADWVDSPTSPTCT